VDSVGLAPNLYPVFLANVVVDLSWKAAALSPLASVKPIHAR
jgi:hypothetical protein